MRQTAQSRQSVLEHLMCRLAGELRNEADTTGIPVKDRIDQ
jgi:hypothetical protein